MATCKAGHPAHEIVVSPKSGKPYCRACARERYHAKRATQPTTKRAVEIRRTHDERLVELYHEAYAAGLLDEILMTRLLGGRGRK